MDRAVADQLTTVSPETGEAVSDNRAFLGRVVGCLAIDHGIRRFLDIGSGLPTQENVHQVAQIVDPDARVVYVDNDLMAVAHARALMANGGGVEAIAADLRDPDDILARPEVRTLIDPGEPVALLLVAIVHFLPEDAGPYRAATTPVEALPPGSFLAISHGWRPDDDEQAQTLAKFSEAYRASSSIFARSREEILAFFEGTDLIEPGLVWSFEWRPDKPLPTGHGKPIGFCSGVGRVRRRAATS